MKKRIISLLLGLAMISTITACSKPDTKETSTKKEGTKSEYSYVIGHYGGVTGQVATAGTAGLNGIKLAIKLQNEKGGVLGGKIGFEFYDDGEVGS